MADNTSPTDGVPAKKKWWDTQSARAACPRAVALMLGHPDRRFTAHDFSDELDVHLQTGLSIASLLVDLGLIVRDGVQKGQTSSTSKGRNQYKLTDKGRTKGREYADTGSIAPD